MMGSKLTDKIVFTLFVIALMASCSSLNNVEQAEVNGKKVQYVLNGNGSPTIVFETGMGPTIATWDSILDSLSKHTQIYAYNRPGYGNSNLRNPPKSTTEVARQLHENLKAQNVPPPYLLVGHSAGGLYVNMFARLYPKETTGVIFLDATHPEQFEYFKNDQKLLYNLLVTSTRKGQRKYEYDIISTALSNFQEAPKFPDVPISVLTAGKSSFLENKKLREKWLEFQKDLSILSGDSKHIVVDESGHYIHRNAPELTISEVLRILDKYRNSR